MASECQVSVGSRQVKVLKTDQKVRIEITRNTAEKEAIVFFSTEDGTAESGVDYEGVVGGTVLLRKGQLSREVVIVLHDNEEEVEGTREKAAQRSFNFVLKGVRNGELSTSRPTMCKIHVKSQNIDYTGFMDSKPFQVISGLFTLYALFGSDLAILAVDPSLDTYFEVATVVCIAFFAFEIALTSLAKRGKYFNGVIFWMDIIAMIALLPSIRLIDYALAGAMANAGSTGTIARAGRAARAGSRAGRTIKLPRLFGKMYTTLSTCFSSSREMQLQMIQQRLSFGATALLPGAVEEDGSERKVVKSESGSSKVGLLLMELFTGKVIVMMMLVLVVSALLEYRNQATQKDLGLHTLVALYEAGGNNLHSAPFMAALAVYVDGATKHGAEYNPGEELLYLRVGGQRVPRLQDPQTTPLRYVADEATGEWIYYDHPEIYQHIRESELGFATGKMGCSNTLGKILDGHLRASCVASALFDNRAQAKAMAQSNIILTLCIVVILCIGMGLVAMDMQTILMDPIERITTVFKTIAAIVATPKSMEKQPTGKQSWASVLSRKYQGTAAALLEKQVEQEAAPESPVENYTSPSSGSLNPIRVLNDYWRSLMSKLVQLEEGFPPDEPLALFITAIKDIEVAFGINMKARRKMLVKLEKEISVPYVAFRRIVFAGDAGSLSFKDLYHHLLKLFSAIKAMLPASVYDNSAHRAVMDAVEAFLQTLPSAIEVMDRIGLRQMESIGLKVKATTELSSGMIYSYVRVQMQLLVRILHVLGGRPVPPSLLTMSLSDCIDELENLARHAMYAGLRTAGVQLDPKKLSSSPTQAFKQVKRLLVEHMMSKLPASVLLTLPPKVKQADGPMDLKRQLEVWLKDQMYERVKQMRTLKNSAEAYSVAQYISLMRDHLVEALGSVFPILKQSVEALKAVAALKKLQSLSPAEAYERVMELAKLGYPAALEQFLPASFGPLPSLEAIKHNPAKCARELMSTVNAANLPTLLREEARTAFAAATKELKKLKLLFHELGTPEGVLDTDAERVKELMMDVVQSYPTLLSTLAAHAKHVVPSPHLLDIETLRRVEAKEVKDQVLMKLMPVLAMGGKTFDLFPVELMQDKLQDVLETAGRFTAMVEGGHNQAMQYVDAAAAAPLRAVIGFLSNEPHKQLGDMHTRELLVILYQLLLERLQVAMEPMLRTAREMGIMDKVESVAAMIPGMSEVRARLLQSGTLVIQALPSSLAEVKQAAVGKVQRLRTASRALEMPLGIKAFAEHAMSMGRDAQTRMAEASEASLEQLLAQAEMTAEHTQEVMKRVLVSADVQSIAALRERMEHLQARVAEAGEETVEQANAAMGEMAALTAALETHEKLTTQVQDLLALAWCKAGADNVENEENDGDDRKMAQWTLQARAEELRQQAADAFAPSVVLDLSLVRSVADVGDRTQELLEHGQELLGDAEQVARSLQLKFGGVPSADALAAVARSQATAAVAKVKEAAATTDFLAALKSGDIGVLAAKMGPYGRLLLSTLTWIKDLLLEKLTELAASVKLPLPPNLKELDIPELVSKMQEAVRARAMEMLEATGLPVQQLLAQVSSFTSLLDSVKELALGRVQGSTLSKEELMDKARALLDQLPSVSDMQALKPAELMAKVWTTNVQELLSGLVPKPIMDLLSTLADQVAKAAADERLAAFKKKAQATAEAGMEQAGGAMAAAAEDPRVAAMAKAVTSVLQYVVMTATKVLQDGMAHSQTIQLLLSQIPAPSSGESLTSLSEDKIRDILRALNSMPKLKAMLADGVPALANVEGASTRELHAALTALSGQREELMNATKKWIREGMDRFVGMGHSKLALPEETLAALAHLPTVEGLRAMGADQKKALVARLGDVGELQLALGLGVAVRTEELKAQPERLEELLVSMQETNVVVQAKEVMKQLPRSLMLGLSQLRKAVASPGGLQNMSEAELRAVLVKMGYPHSLQALLGASNAPLPSLEEALAKRHSLATVLRSGVSFPLMVGPSNAAMDALRERMGELKAVMESPMIQSMQTLLTVWASIKDAMAGMFGGGSASDGGASQSAAQVVGKLLERIMMLLRQSEALQPALRKLQALQSSVGGGVLGSAMEDISKLRKEITAHYKEQAKAPDGVLRQLNAAEDAAEKKARGEAHIVEMSDSDDDEAVEIRLGLAAHQRKKKKNVVLAAVNVEPVNIVSPSASPAAAKRSPRGGRVPPQGDDNMV